ncbi:MAG: LysR family transcriptional regulator [Pseudomonadota bacterium]
MTREPSIRDLSLKSLELFQLAAHRTSLQEVAAEAGLSVSTVSHHLRTLERQLGTSLLDHTKRPMVLTPKGTAFLRNIDDALLALRKAKAEATAGAPKDASYLRLGAIEDFDSDIIPELAVRLSHAMPRCDFLYHTDQSQTLITMLRERRLDLGIASFPADQLDALVQRSLLRDPFVVVLPADREVSADDVVRGKTDLPFLRFSGDLLIARQIAAQLSRLGLSAPSRFECASDRTLMAMVAAGAGWTITTPMLFSRGRRFHDQVRLHPFPGKTFARTLSIAATPDCALAVLDLVDTTLRTLIAEHTLAPMIHQAPWLTEQFRLID